MIDGGAEHLERGFMGYLRARPSTTPAEFAARFHLSDRSAAYWLGCLVKSGRVKIGRIESQSAGKPSDGQAATDASRHEGDDPLQAVVEVSDGFSRTPENHS